MAAIKKSVNLLPEYLRTDKNSKFLSSTIDQFIQTPEVERLDGFVGSKITPNYNPSTDFYLNETSSLRNNYSLEPALIFKDGNNNITDVVSYDDLINEIASQGGKNSNLDATFNSKFYSYDPLINWDTLVNFTDYYWLPTGPEVIVLLTATVTAINGYATYTMENGYKLSNGMKIEVAGVVYIVEGVGESIKLINFNLLDSYDRISTTYNETFDGVEFDKFPFDGDKRLPLIPDYITVNKASLDLNPWSRYNRWFHKEIIRISSEINKTSVIYPLAARATRPIIEFRSNLKLYNFGIVGIKNVDLIDNSTVNAFATVEGSYGYHIDGILLQQGHRVIFNADTDLDVRGKIFQVNFDITGSTPVLHLIGATDSNPADMNSVSINLGIEYYGTSWFFSTVTRTWIYSQQHNKLNQPPLFDLFTNDGISYTDNEEANNFVGNQIFGYDIGSGTNDKILGFPLQYQNTIGSGSYLFKNYFMTGIITLINNNVSRTVSTSIAYLKLNGILVNVWATPVKYKIPILENQVILSNTNTITVTCLNSPIDTNLTATVYVNNIKVSATATITSGKINLTTVPVLAENDVVLLKIETDQVPNNNGYYETPIGLTNNPLNSSPKSLTLSELGDHLSTMIGKTPAYIGNNLRDITGYSKYGSRLVINVNPISFAQIFLGKKEHNVVDALTSAGNDYEQFKMNFIRLTGEVDSSMTPSAAVDLILTKLNISKDLKSMYQRSDMIGYGQNKTVRTFTVTDVFNIEYPIGFNFDLTQLSFQSVIIYLNDIQLIHNSDYTFNYINGSVTLLKSLNINDVIEINCYTDTLGCYIPPTPTKLGLWPAFEPAKFNDTSVAVNSVPVLLGHDGSITTAYNDYRDNIIIEFETRIFNNIKVLYKKDLYDVRVIFPGAFRKKQYTIPDLRSIHISSFSRWAGQYGIDTTTNSTFDAANWKTWNHTGSVDRVFGKPVSGTWKALFLHFYDTSRPDRPWRMLGYAIRPSWWNTYYGVGPYTSSNTLMWTDLRDGYSRGENTYFNDFKRPNLLSIIPVDASGNLKRPDTFLVTENSYQDRKAKWKFGDIGPAENAWRQSSQSNFSLLTAAALLDPSTFCSNLYDVSRSIINAIGQVTYKEDDLYLDPRKLVIEGEDNNQISGFGSYIIEKGRQRDQNYISKLRQDLKYLNFNLFHKVGGFVSKDKLQIIIDSVDPTSTSPGVILPSEDYSLILNVSNPVKTARISGIIVQRSNGNFVIKGYDIDNPYFEILQPIVSMSSSVVKVGGVSESFSEWSNIVNNGNKGLSFNDTTSAESVTSRYYKQGQLLRYNNKFYRVKTGHNADSTFDSALFQVLSELPVKGGATVQSPSSFSNKVIQVPYGSELTTIQEVYDIILGYGAYLETQGFIFDEFNTDLNEMLNWKFTGKEFLYWTTQNWADGNLITLSPFANYIKYNFPNSIVDNISTGKYQYSLLKADGKPYPIDKFTMVREDAICTIKTRDPNEGLFFAVLNSIQKEHGMVFNNRTVFNDTIYDIETGYKQRRIKLSGFRTKNWNGDLFSPGFVYDNVKIVDWTPYKKYLPATVVRYNGRYYGALATISSSATFDFTKWDQLRDKPVPKLLPNFDYKINQFEDFYSLDIDNFDSNQQQLAQHITGYTPRVYLNNIFTNPISQYKFYQGMIKDKGTKNAFNKLSKASEYANKGEISFKEEWAFRIGHYGSFETLNEIEFQLKESTYLENPYIVKFVDTIPTDPIPLINYITSSTLLLTPVDFSPTIAIGSYAGTWEDNNLKLTTAGYVRPDDITSTAYNKNSLLDIANNSIIKNGDTIWLGFQENGDWTVYRYTKQLAEITGVFVSAPGSEITFVTDTHHNLQLGDVISIVRFNEQVNGVYIVSSIVTINQFTVVSELASIENAELLNYGALYKFEEARYKNLDDLAAVTDLLKLNEGDKVWIDQGIDSKWQVYEKIKNYSVKVSDTVNIPAGQKFGTSIFALENSPVMLASAPGWRIDNTFGQGRVKVFNKINGTWTRKYDYVLNSSQKTYCSATSSTQFGHALQYDIAKKLYITGAPEATYVRATGTNILTISTGTGYARPYIKEGLVKIDSRQEDFPIFTEIVIANPYPENYSRFGHSIYINQSAATTSTLMLIGAPGAASTGSVYAYKINQIVTTTSTTYTITTGTLFKIQSTSSVTLYAGDQWGHKIVGSPDGSRIAISAPGKNTTSTGVVEIFNNNLQYLQTLSYPAGKFGYDVAMSTNYIIISAPELKNTNEPYGKVGIYKLTNLTSTGTYTLYQTISNPLSTDDLKFGYSISISEDENTIGVGALGKTRSTEQKFDENNNVDNTTFDNDTTKFKESIPDAGTVYLYNKIGNKFIQAEELNDVKIVEGIDITDIVPLDVRTLLGLPPLGGPTISNIVLSSNPANIGTNITVTFETDQNINYIIGRVDEFTYGPYGGTLGNDTNPKKHTFYIDTSRFPAGIRNLAIYVSNATTGLWGVGYTTLTLEPAIYTITAGSRYGSAVVVTNNEVFVGAPTNQSNLLLPPIIDESRLFMFSKINAASQSWKVLREQVDTVNVATVGRVALIDTLKEEIVDYLDVVDPVKGKIVGIAEQELKYKAAFDPATYSIGLAGTIVNVDTNWLDDHMGELWWDLSTVKYMWYEQGNEIFRKNNWGRLFPGASIDVYEWVKSDLLPSEWAAQADTTRGLITGISGQPKYPDNSVISVKQLFNNVTGAFENVYYFWVKNKVTVPAVKNRRISGFQVASYIADPVANGLKFVEILSPSALAFANIQPMLISDRINANIATDTNSVTPKHTEWLLLNENDPASVPNTLLEKKLIDSFLGHDSLGNVVPSNNLTYRNRYGIGIRPQQTLFKNRLLALRNSLFFVNSVLLENRIVGSYSFENLNKVEAIPSLLLYEYDKLVEDAEALSEEITINYIRAELTCYVENGKIKSVIIINPGRLYSVSPKIVITPLSNNTGSDAEIIAELDAQGSIVSTKIVNPGNGYLNDTSGLIKAKVTVRPHTIIVQINADYGNRWTKHSFDYKLKTWVTVQTQKYNTPLFWKTVDWVSNDYNSFKTIQYTISNLFDLGSVTTIDVGDYIKIKNIGDGKYAILEKVKTNGNYIPSYNIVYREKGTIQLLDNLWNYDLGKYAYDKATIEETLYDQIPDQELYYILLALKNDIFINSLKMNWNLFFFAAVKYALTEQKLLDWAFKTSFINVFNNIGTLDQRSVYKLNNEEYFENYINEVKPYHTKIRSYTSIYDKLEQSNLYTTDFDLPSYYNTITDSLNVITFANTATINQYPWKSWKDNYKFYIGALEVGYAGSGYIQRPSVTITTATGDTGSGASAEAYIRNGEVYKVLVTKPGSGYVIPPIVTISNSNIGTDTARVSVVMANDTVRKNTIGMKFDRTSLIGDISKVTVTDEFLCDGTADKFTLTWLASADKRTIVPLLDGKLVFGADYTIEYYQVKVSQTGIDIPQAFPKNSWEGERMVDHRYAYFLNTSRSNELPGHIRHYAKFVFLNQVPTYGQVFKITYNKSIDLYNAVDRINSLYNPTDLMPGKELPLLMTGAEYPGISVQGLKFEQTPNWDNTGTQYDAAPWGDLVSNYVVASPSGFLYNQFHNIVLTIDSNPGIIPGMKISVVGESSPVFRENTVVTEVSNNNVTIETLDIEDTKIKHIYSTSTKAGSIIQITTIDSFHNAVKAGDLIKISGVNSLYGYGIEAVRPGSLISTTGTVSITISAPTATQGGIQAIYTPVKSGNTVTSFTQVVKGMGYLTIPTVTITHDSGVITTGTAAAFLDPGFNIFVAVTTCTDTIVQVLSQNTLSSTATTLSSGANFRLSSLLSNLDNTSKLLDHVVPISSFTNVTTASIQTYARYQDVLRAAVTLSSTSTEIVSATNSTHPFNPYPNPIVYTISNSTDGRNRAIVSLNDVTGATISGSVDVRVYGATELEFYTPNTNYNSLDSAISGSNFSNTALGYSPEDIIIDGNNFLNATDSYAPEECVPGYVCDSVGINVFTTANSMTYPMVVSGAFTANTVGNTTAKLSWIPSTPVGFRVQANGKTYDRVNNESALSSSTQYCIFDGSIVVGPQPSNTLIGYSFVTVGANVIVDSNYVSATVTSVQGNTGTMTVSSLLNIDEVQSVYVLLDGNEIFINYNSDPSALGYILGSTSPVNNRAMITVTGLFSGSFNLEVWFFDTLFPKFNRVHEEYFTIGATATSNLTLSRAPGTIEPVTQQVIVEKISSSARSRMLPPWVSYYKISSGIVTYPIDSKNSRPNTYTLNNVKVYLNGIELRPGYDFTVDIILETVTLIKPGIFTGDAIAISPILDYDYFVIGNTVQLSTPVTNTTIKITSFTDHDNMMIRTERFKGDDTLILTYPVINENYVWVTVEDKPLIAGFDYIIREDMRSIEFSEFINVFPTDDIVVVVINPPSYNTTVLGYRIFKDMFDRHHFRRISEYFSTRLAAPLQYSDSSIVVENGDHLLQPNPNRNFPGVIYVDGERIEYVDKNGNILSGLRRSTLGTGPAKFSDIGTEVIDQSIRQMITTIDYSLIQHIPSSNTTTYVISTVTNNTSTFSVISSTHVGNGILFSTLTNAVDQVEIYYGGRRLRKASLNVHDKSRSYYDSAASTIVYPPEFTITTSTRQLILNIAETITTGTRITIVKKEGALWTGTEMTSLLTSTSTQANFLRSRPAELPNIYFYGGDKVLYENSNALTDDSGEPIEGY